MNILFYIEPITELNRPRMKHPWVYFTNLFIQSLENSCENNQFAIVTGDGLEIEASGLGKRLVILKHTQFVPVLGNSALEVVEQFYKNKSSPGIKDLSKNLKKQLKDFIPDVCISFSASLLIKEAFPGIPILHFELGLFSRPPFPRTGFLDPLGMFQNCFLAQNKDDIQKYEPKPEDLEVIKLIRERFIRELEVNPFRDYLEEKLDKFKGTVLVILQPPYHYAFDLNTDYKDPYDLLIQTLDTVSENVAVICTDHPQHPIISDETNEFLQKKYKNFIWMNEFQLYQYPTAYIMEFADVIVTVSSTVGLQSLLWKKHLIVPGKSQLNIISDGESLKDIENLVNKEWNNTGKENVLAWNLTRYTIPFELLLKKGVLLNSLKKAIIYNAYPNKFFEETYIDINEIIEFYRTCNVDLSVQELKLDPLKKLRLENINLQLEHEEKIIEHEEKINDLNKYIKKIESYNLKIIFSKLLRSLTRFRKFK